MISSLKLLNMILKCILLTNYDTGDFFIVKTYTFSHQSIYNFNVCFSDNKINITLEFLLCDLAVIKVIYTNEDELCVVIIPEFLK